MTGILVAIDGSPAASDALDVAIELAREPGVRLTALSVRVMLVRGVVVTAPDEPEATSVLADAARRAAATGVELATVTRAGDPREEILATAEELGADLVVLGSRGLGELRPALLGSVSRAVVARSRRPVVVVRRAESRRSKESIRHAVPSSP
jgi:nucleotide-binding universal stress UspA family protein